eukprot:3380016-Prymnesium_polylepis.1
MLFAGRQRAERAQSSALGAALGHAAAHSVRCAFACLRGIRRERLTARRPARLLCAEIHLDQPLRLCMSTTDFKGEQQCLPPCRKVFAREEPTKPKCAHLKARSLTVIKNS